MLADRYKIEDQQASYFLTIIPGKDGKKGKIIASTYLSVYCYEAER